MKKHLFNLKKYIFTMILIGITTNAFAFETYMGPETYRAYGKQQIKTKDSKGNTQIITPHFKDYSKRNDTLSEKHVCIYAQKSPAYGYRYVLYTPIKRYVGHHRIMQKSLNGYGYDPIPCDETMPCFKNINEAKHYYYPELY